MKRSTTPPKRVLAELVNGVEEIVNEFGWAGFSEDGDEVARSITARRLPEPGGHSIVSRQGRLGRQCPSILLIVKEPYPPRFQPHQFFLPPLRQAVRTHLGLMLRI